MPLEKIALTANSSQVSAHGPLRQAVRLTFRDGVLAPYRVIGPASLLAWFLQYSSMSFVFQLADSALALGLGVERVAYGDDLDKADTRDEDRPADRRGGAASSASAVAAGINAGSMLKLAKDVGAATVAGAIESAVSNRAEAQRYFGLERFRSLESRAQPRRLVGLVGPAFSASVARNSLMTYSAFVATPALYRQHVPEEYKSSSSLFLFGLAVNMFGGNVIAVTQQTLWGRALDSWSASPARPISYTSIVSESLRAEGVGAFLTSGKWLSRVLMNAPAEGTLSWFYNRVLPIGEPVFVRSMNTAYSWLMAGSSHLAAENR
eukprot:scaffold196736_cov30-Tisochrysis_lutea.AAC.1